MTVRFQNILGFEQRLVAELKVFCFIAFLSYRWKVKKEIKLENWGGAGEPNQRCLNSFGFFFESIKFQM